MAQNSAKEQKAQTGNKMNYAGHTYMTVPSSSRGEGVLSILNVLRCLEGEGGAVSSWQSRHKDSQNSCKAMIVSENRPASRTNLFRDAASDEVPNGPHIKQYIKYSQTETNINKWKIEEA